MALFSSWACYCGCLNAGYIPKAKGHRAQDALEAAFTPCVKQPDGRAGRPAYSLLQLYQCMNLTMELKNSSRLGFCVTAVLQMATGDPGAAKELAVPLPHLSLFGGRVDFPGPWAWGLSCPRPPPQSIYNINSNIKIYIIYIYIMFHKRQTEAKRVFVIHITKWMMMHAYYRPKWSVVLLPIPPQLPTCQWGIVRWQHTLWQEPEGQGHCWCGWQQDQNPKCTNDDPGKVEIGYTKHVCKAAFLEGGRPCIPLYLTLLLGPKSKTQHVGLAKFFLEGGNSCIPHPSSFHFISLVGPWSQIQNFSDSDSGWSQFRLWRYKAKIWALRLRRMDHKAGEQQAGGRW